jgi:nitrite reductase/ring-hydroxylating ferredoxin subunit
MTTTTDLAATQTHDEPACLTHPDGTRRRAFLGVAAAVGAVCAGCSSSKSSSASTGSTTSAAGSSAGGGTSSSSAASSSSDTGSASPSSSSGSSGSTGSAALAAASAVPVGGGTVLTDQKIVVTQPTAGTFKAFTAVCTHQGCVVGTVESGMIVCPCHGSRFHIADGSVANGPAAQALTPVAVKVVNGQIVQA